MNTTIAAPEMTDTVREYVAVLDDYNAAVSELNTCFGGATEYVSRYTYGKDAAEAATDAIAKNREFSALRAEQLREVDLLAEQLESYIKAGAAQQYLDYQQALYDYKKANGEL